MKVDGLNLIQLNQKGKITITIDDLEDFWTLANVIHIGDKIQSQILRKVNKITSVGKSDKRKVLTKAIVKITEIDYQPGVNEMQLRGTLTHDVEDARAGTFQRILLEIGRPFSLSKKYWDQMSYDEISDAANPVSNASVAAVVMQAGLSHICIVGRNTTVVREKVQKAIPKVKVYGSSGKNAEAKIKFYQLTADALVRNVKVDDMKCVIIASPGFIATEFMSYLQEHAAQYNLQPAFQANKFVTGNISSGYPQELETLLQQPQMQSHVSTLKATTQACAMDELMKTMNNSPDMVMFGEEQVFEYVNSGAIKKLLVTDEYIRHQDQDRRLKFIELKQRLIDSGVDVIIFSTRHQSGEQLGQLGGVAAILNYAIAIEDVDLDDDDDDGPA